ncbi:MAG: rhodanese-related sulfurtransferase [Bacteroidota bacterium]|nr:rhodanese-related sulfurtransferase [Bacteroidota bacterium]MDP4217885.1 rhodanese-related sulfurtransferase [Bacteroidota bacterium]MDP4245059.1 rhodanese-related sulfurtransferase [Bacteroidota bacterium]MDP4255199.1 rhodanese-related sulfurtransferase [Bacteroidota bacterium]MDP4257656.1 rhodanese-related sulfurtransferase [Bacteroidota bacterium]
MAPLHNRVSQKELKERLYQETEPRITLSFYRYTLIPDTKKFRDELYLALDQRKVFGRIYIAPEGINAQVSVPRSRFPELKELLDAIPGLGGLRLNQAVDDDGKSFWVLKIKIRGKIVADGIDDPAFDMSRKGRYVDADEFNRLAEQPGTILVDMRNHYEYEVGHFRDAIEVPSDTFREQLPMSAAMLEKDKDRNIIMYCTGGIRCEKASAYLLHRGFRNVFHLEGGIIQYANTVKEKGLENKFLGKNFVFDDRLGERISEEIIAHCHQCGQPADTHTNCRNDGCHLLFIQCEACAAAYEGCCSVSCLEVLRLPPEARAALRKGKDNGRKVFNKSKARLRPKQTP